MSENRTEYCVNKNLSDYFANARKELNLQSLKLEMLGIKATIVIFNLSTYNILYRAMKYEAQSYQIDFIKNIFCGLKIAILNLPNDNSDFFLKVC